MEKCHVIAVTNQKGGVGKTTTTVNLGVGLARMGKRVLLVDADPQGSLTVSLGVKNPDELPVSIATVMQNTVDDKAMPQDYGIIHHSEGVDLLPSNIELSAFEVGLFNTMSREMVGVHHTGFEDARTPAIARACPAHAAVLRQDRIFSFRRVVQEVVFKIVLRFQPGNGSADICLQSGKMLVHLRKFQSCIAKEDQINGSFFFQQAQEHRR